MDNDLLATSLALLLAAVRCFPRSALSAGFGLRLSLSALASALAFVAAVHVVGDG